MASKNVKICLEKTTASTNIQSISSKVGTIITMKRTILSKMLSLKPIKPEIFENKKIDGRFDKEAD